MGCFEDELRFKLITLQVLIRSIETRVLEQRLECGETFDDTCQRTDSAEVAEIQGIAGFDSLSSTRNSPLAAETSILLCAAVERGDAIRL